MRAAEYDTNDERYYAITALEGAHYREDNKRVYEELQALTIDGPGWTFIKQFPADQEWSRSCFGFESSG